MQWLSSCCCCRASADLVAGYRDEQTPVRQSAATPADVSAPVAAQPSSVTVTQQLVEQHALHEASQNDLTPGPPDNRLQPPPLPQQTPAFIGNLQRFNNMADGMASTHLGHGHRAAASQGAGKQRHSAGAARTTWAPHSADISHDLQGRSANPTLPHRTRRRASGSGLQSPPYSTAGPPMTAPLTSSRPSRQLPDVNLPMQAAQHAHALLSMELGLSSLLDTSSRGPNGPPGPRPEQAAGGRISESTRPRYSHRHSMPDLAAGVRDLSMYTAAMQHGIGIDPGLAARWATLGRRHQHKQQAGLGASSSGDRQRQSPVGVLPTLSPQQSYTHQQMCNASQPLDRTSLPFQRTSVVAGTFPALSGSERSTSGTLYPQPSVDANSTSYFRTSARSSNWSHMEASGAHAARERASGPEAHPLQQLQQQQRSSGQPLALTAVPQRQLAPQQQQHALQPMRANFSVSPRSAFQRSSMPSLSALTAAHGGQGQSGAASPAHAASGRRLRSVLSMSAAVTQPHLEDHVQPTDVEGSR